MPQPLSGPGVGLPLPQNLYPANILSGGPLNTPTNRMGLAPGDALPLPAGNWYVDCLYSTIEVQDPITGTWMILPSSAWRGGPQYVKSDGFTCRVANRTGCVASVSVTAPGDGNYVQSTTTVTVTGSTASVVPIVGGALALSGGTLTANGAGYGKPPIVLIPAPANYNTNANGVGGIPASGYCTIASGTISGFTFNNPGAGYQTAPTAVIVPDPTDPNISTGITAGTITFTLTAAGSLTGALVRNGGAAITPANITLTVAGAGANGTLTANVMQSITAASIVGSMLGPFGTVAALLTTVGGAPNAGTFTNDPFGLYQAFRPRPAQIGLSVTGAATSTLTPQTGKIYDGGLFQSTPTGIIAVNMVMGSNTGTLTNTGTLVLTTGGTNDIVTIQPAP